MGGANATVSGVSNLRVGGMARDELPLELQRDPSVDLRRNVVSSALVVSGAVAAFFMVYHWTMGLPGRALASLSALVAAALLVLVLRITRSHRPAVMVATLYAAGITLGMLATGGFAPADFVWCFVVPPLITYAGGRELSRWLLPLYLLAVMGIVLWPGFPQRALWGELELGVRFVGLLVLASAIAYLYEMTRSRSQALLTAEVEERRAAQQELAETNERLVEAAEAAARYASEAQAANLAKTRFLSHMSHDIRTPLTGVIGMTSVLELTELDEHQRACLHTIRVSGDALNKLIGDVLDLARIDAGRMQPSLAPCEPALLLEGVREVLLPQVGAKGLDLRCELDPGLPRKLMADARRLERVLLNLAGNAVKFTQEGGVVLRAGPRPGGDPRWWRLEVRDSGIGIPSDQHKRIFDSFTQVELPTSRRHGGSGLGLAICARLVALMGGELGLESEEGRGSRFWADLPMVPVGSLEQDDPCAREPAPALPPLMLLVVDDSEIVRRVLGGLLRKGGHTVLEAADGHEALELLARKRFDAVLMDMQMPEVDGCEATRRLRAGWGGVLQPGVPVLGVTALADHGSRAACLEAGMDRVIIKPVQHEQLLRALAAVLPAP